MERDIKQQSGSQEGWDKHVLACRILSCNQQTRQTLDSQVSFIPRLSEKILSTMLTLDCCTDEPPSARSNHDRLCPCLRWSTIPHDATNPPGRLLVFCALLQHYRVSHLECESNRAVGAQHEPAWRCQRCPLLDTRHAKHCIPHCKCAHTAGTLLSKYLTERPQ
jgi:hypothetical protein